MNDIYNILIKPIITEKSEGLRAKYNRVVFMVDLKSNKELIKQSVEKIFNVKVKSVKTSIIYGKKKRYGRVLTKRSDYKKAFVDLMPGSKLEFFEGM